MKIYLAGASKEIEEITPRLHALRNAGHTIMFDWTIPVKELGASPTDEGQALKSAMDDLAAVKNADVVWLCAPKEGSTSTGAWFELGAAIASGVPVIVSGPYHRCIFAQLAARRFETHDETLAYLVSCAPPKPERKWIKSAATWPLHEPIFVPNERNHTIQFQANALTKLSRFVFGGDDRLAFEIVRMRIGGKVVQDGEEGPVEHFGDHYLLAALPEVFPGQLVEIEVRHTLSFSCELKAQLVFEQVFS